MTIIGNLNRLAEIAPDVCQSIHPRYQVGEYSFGSHLDGSIYAKTGGIEVTGRPALAWLRDAIEAAIETRGWNYQEVRLGWGNPRGHIVRIYYDFLHVAESRPVDNMIEALLAAFVAALEEK